VLHKRSVGVGLVCLTIFFTLLYAQHSEARWAGYIDDDAIDYLHAHGGHKIFPDEPSAAGAVYSDCKAHLPDGGNCYDYQYWQTCYDYIGPGCYQPANPPSTRIPMSGFNAHGCDNADPYPAPELWWTSYWFPNYRSDPPCPYPMPLMWWPDPPFTLESSQQSLGAPLPARAVNRGFPVDPASNEPTGFFCDATSMFVGNPVNVATGNKFEYVVDLSISTPGIPLYFARAYNSQSTVDSPLGYGWAHNFAVSLRDASYNNTNRGTRVRIRDADGRVLYFSQAQPGAAFLGESGVKDRLTLDASGNYNLRRNEGTLTYRFRSDKENQ
jgi:hypothetical protein